MSTHMTALTEVSNTKHRLGKQLDDRNPVSINLSNFKLISAERLIPRVWIYGSQ